MYAVSSPASIQSAPVETLTRPFVPAPAPAVSTIPSDHKTGRDPRTPYRRRNQAEMRDTWRRSLASTIKLDDAEILYQALSDRARLIADIKSVIGELRHGEGSYGLELLKQTLKAVEPTAL